MPQPMPVHGQNFLLARNLLLLTGLLLNLDDHVKLFVAASPRVPRMGAAKAASSPAASRT